MKTRKKWLRVGEAARRLNVTPQSVRRYCALQLLKSKRTPGGHLHVSLASLLSYLPSDAAQGHS